MKRRFWLMGAIVLACAAPALAILGAGDIVYDPSNFAEAVQELSQLVQQSTRLLSMLNLIQNQYTQMLWMAQPAPVNLFARYRALATPWTLSLPTNTYGTTSGWTEGIDTGVNVPGGYASAIQPLAAYGSAFDSVPADQQQRLRTEYATVELTDGANLAAMQTLGDLRGRAPDVETAIQNLENDSLSSDPAMNTEIAVLNKINAADVMGLRNTQDANKVLVALAEGQIIQAKRQRDAEAQAFNDHIQFMTSGQAVMAAQAAGASAAMLAWRMP